MALAGEAKNQFKTQFKALLVDLDGTLLDNNELSLTLSFFSKVIFALNKYGRIRAWRALRAVYQEFETASAKETNADRFERVFSQKLGLGVAEGRELYLKLIKEIFPKLGHHFDPVPGAKEFLDWAKRHFRLILATNPVWPQEIVELRVKWAGIDPATFEWMSHWGLMRAVKPLKEYYQGILEHRELKASECLMIGDSMKKDLPASALGISVFILDDDTLKKPRAVCVPLKVKTGSAKCWTGNYKGLRGLLSD